MAFAVLAFVFAIVFSLLWFIFWVYHLVDAIKSDFDPKEMKLIWILIMIFLPFIGTIMYSAVGRSQRMLPPSEEYV